MLLASFLGTVALSLGVVQAGSCRIKQGSFPKCARQCFSVAQNQTTFCPKDHVDIACLCSRPEVTGVIYSCLDASCNTTDLQAAAQYGKDLCDAAAANSTNSTTTPTTTVNGTLYTIALPTISTSISIATHNEPRPTSTADFTILPISVSASASASSNGDDGDDAQGSDDGSQDLIVASSTSTWQTTSDVAPTTIALAKANGGSGPEVTITSTLPTPTGKKEDSTIPNSQSGGADSRAAPSFVLLGGLSILSLGSIWI